jgi:hypothetical protein
MFLVVSVHSCCCKINKRAGFSMFRLQLAARLGILASSGGGRRRGDWRGAGTLRRIRGIVSLVLRLAPPRQKGVVHTLGINRTEHRSLVRVRQIVTVEKTKNA